MRPTTTRRTPALITRERELGLRRVVVPTTLGPVVARVGRVARVTQGEDAERIAGDPPVPRRRTRPAGRSATILLHGAAGSWTTWTPLIAASDSMATPLHDLIVPDLPGWGESGELPLIDSVGEMSDAVAELARALGYTSWRVIGHSLGGVIALDIAARHPRETTSVALVSPSGAAVLDAARRPLRGGLRLPALAGMLLAMRLLSTWGRRGRGGRAVMRTLDRVGVLRGLSAPLFALPSEVHRSVIAAIAADARPATFRRAAILAAAYDTDAWRGIVCPVGSLRGENDVFSATSDADEFARLIPGFREVRLADAGHFAHVERPTAAFAVLTALAGVRRTTVAGLEKSDTPERADAATSARRGLAATTRG
ncbi:alpha/beta fold hydrolase [Microbacterium sp. P01]|uniref:alpha/beta fold hydrolase n=1 Tax=unclassified Microbacterium TaxID=2609290 RepID=UPI00366FDA02